MEVTPKNKYTNVWCWRAAPDIISIQYQWIIYMFSSVCHTPPHSQSSDELDLLQLVTR